jgi:hypothetical protein
VNNYQTATDEKTIQPHYFLVARDRAAARHLKNEGLIMLYIAFWETSNFTFEGFGNTSEEAVWALQRGWEVHCSQFKYADPDLLKKDEISVRLAIRGECHRDKEILKP